MMATPNPKLIPTPPLLFLNANATAIIVKIYEEIGRLVHL